MARRWLPDRHFCSDLLSASALGFLGDLVCQLVVEKRKPPQELSDLRWGHHEGHFEPQRLWALTVFGGAYTGGFLHFLYKFYSPTVRAISAYLPSALSLPLSRSESMAHCFACAWVDNIHCGSFYIPVYFLSVGLMQSDSLQASKENLMAEWWTTYVTCTGFWVPFMCANWRFCPAAHRVKAMQTANLFWNVIIDHLAHREEVHEHAHHEE
ncbi:unnamed protein product [Durusdinium trenchii]|uniref:Peroxisomal membrane protein 2 n=1 Tax=Durusdinium trenchii TaxID=1381693 RepID=A0ABP0NB60_9DINO